VHVNLIHVRLYQNVTRDFTLTKSNSSSGDDDGELLVTFFNGETVSLKRGIAIRIPEQKFNRLSFDIQLPESQRRKQSAQRHSVSRPTRRTVWEDERRELQLVRYFLNFVLKVYIPLTRRRQQSSNANHY
jgi:hypothetical protein